MSYVDVETKRRYDICHFSASILTTFVILIASRLGNRQQVQEVPVLKECNIKLAEYFLNFVFEQKCQKCHQFKLIRC